jgi:hypothetical protein
LPFRGFFPHCFKDFFRYEEINAVRWKNELFFYLKLTNLDEFDSNHGVFLLSQKLGHPATAQEYITWIGQWKEERW